MIVRTIRVHAHGGPEVLRLEDVELAAPGAGEALVRHQAIGVNFIDVYHRTGLYGLRLPAVLGSEAAGVVEAIGPEVTEVAVGDRVAYATGGFGAYAEAAVRPARHLVHLPAGIDAVTAAASLLKGMTSEYLVQRTCPVREEDWVLLHAAAGGVGLIAAQWLASIGAHVIGTVGSDAKVEAAREAGCAHVVVYTREDFVAKARELTGGQGVRVVYDSVGKDTFERSLDCLAPRGMLVAFGNASGKPGPFDPMRLAAGSFFLTRATLFHYVATRPELEASAHAFFERVLDGRIVIRPPQRFALADAADAHRSIESRGTIGSTVLIP